MIALAFVIAWAGYSTGLYGYCVVKRYNVCFSHLFKAVDWTWPPPQDMPDNEILPTCITGVLTPKQGASTGTVTTV